MYQKGDSSKKEGDDAPIRLYVMFEYDPEKSSFFKAIKYEVIRILYGEYPPHSSLNYFWASKQQSIPFIENPYSDLIMMVPVASGQGEVGEWLEHTVNVVEDYRAAFGEDPPPIAGIAVMSDSDNTGESAKAYIDFIKIYKKSANEQSHVGCSVISILEPAAPKMTKSIRSLQSPLNMQDHSQCSTFQMISVLKA